MGSFLLPPKPGVCQSCAVDHAPDEAHNQQSLYWQYWFRGQHGRWPTWKDAVANCSPEVRAHWEKELRAMNAWTGWEGDTPPGPDGLTPEGDNLGAEAVLIDSTPALGAFRLEPRIEPWKAPKKKRTRGRCGSKKRKKGGNKK